MYILSTLLFVRTTLTQNQQHPLAKCQQNQFPITNSNFEYTGQDEVLTPLKKYATDD